MGFTYSVTLNVTGKKCVVIGGGNVAERKVLSLLEEGADVVVVTPSLSETLQSVSAQFLWEQQNYTAELLQDAFLVIAATDNAKVNTEVAEDCHRNGILVNVADNREISDFTVNATVKRGDLSIGISTGGASPSLARALRKQLEQQYGEEYTWLLSYLKAIRKEAMDTIPDSGRRRAFLQQLAEMNLIRDLQTESKEEVEKRVRTCLSSYWD